MAGECKSIDEVRRAVDRLDREIVRLLALRQNYVEQAGRLKQDRTDVHNEGRIAEVIANVIGEADRRGLSRRIAEPVWRVLVERSIAHEYAVYDKKKNP